MQLQITGRNTELTDALKEKINTKFSHLESHLNHIISAHFTIEINKNRQIAEAQLTVPGTAIHAQAESEDMYVTIDLLEKKLMRQIDKYKEKLVDHR